jgi:hypothetical protein
MLELSLVRAPLDEPTRQTVIREYNRLTGQGVTEGTFRHLTEESPGGPAVHALLRAPDDRVVGHLCAYAYPLCWNGEERIGASGEYLFVHEQFRNQRIRDARYANTAPALALIREVCRYANEELAWDPVLLTARREVSILHQLAGATPMPLELRECLLVLRPWEAFRLAQHVSRRQRVAMLVLGLFQAPLWTLISLVPWPTRKKLRPVSHPKDFHPREDLPALSFSLDSDFLAWRYWDEHHRLFGLSTETGSMLAVKTPPRRFLRVLDTNLDLDRVPLFPLVCGLVREARRKKSLGVRWALYRNGGFPKGLLGRLRRLGLVCARRTRMVSVSTRSSDLASAERWQFSDAAVA